RAGGKGADHRMPTFDPGEDHFGNGNTVSTRVGSLHSLIRWLSGWRSRNLWHDKDGGFRFERPGRDLGQVHLAWGRRTSTSGCDQSASCRHRLSLVQPTGTKW